MNTDEALKAIDEGVGGHVVKHLNMNGTGAKTSKE